MALKNQIEAILYLKGQPVSLTELSELASCDREDAYDALLELMEDYAHRDSALEVLEVETGFALQLREPFTDMVTDILPPEIGLAVTRTLAAIVLRGPITQVELVELRGSGAYQHVAELVEKGFIRKQRLPANRSYLLEVTNKFHQCYEVEKFDELLLESAIAEPESTD
ncbi:SMC-Scp complex subunit ScpB [Synechococcus sp. PCC 7336]|uniref:SMC-Scp complex subunit ScpB n=1 Tax=Synechococcus sp. PCC 7336 TaxID=195250 RepID=UPI000349808D|nr:SMC-Scp complex subunit ScpB [Synechococcus sp. PCC 7336]